MSASPAVAFNPLGTTHSVTFLCGNAAGFLTPPSGATGTVTPAPGNGTSTGCFDVQATVTDITAGVGGTFTTASCAGIAVDVTSSQTSCDGVANPLCAAGSVPNSGSCSTCPAGLTFSPINLDCETTNQPTTCPPGTTAFRSAHGTGAIVYCFAPTLSPSPRQGNEMVVTMYSATPHVYLVEFTGFVGTTATGTCPAGTTLVPNANVTSSITGPACAFSITVQKKYLEATNLQIVPIGDCGGSIAVTNGSFVGGSPCLFKVKATGMVVLKTGVDCANEPASGSPAPADFITDPTNGIVPTYLCANSNLSVVGVGVPNLQLTLTSSTGTINPFCIPQSRVVPAPTATATGTGSTLPTAVPPNTSTPVPSPTAGPGTVLPSPTALPTPSAFRQPAFCVKTGSPTVSTTTNGTGFAGSTTVDITAQVGSISPSLVRSSGTFAGNGVPVAGIGMYTSFFYSNPNPVTPAFCPPDGSPIYTDATGFSTCTTSTDSQAQGQFVPTDISFVANCEEYGIHTGFIVGQPPLGQAFAHFDDPFCVLRTGFGPVDITATFTSTVNTQPPLTTGPVVLGEFGAPTATSVPAPTNTPIPTDTSTPLASATPSVTDTPGPTDTPTITPTPSMTSTPVTQGPLSFSLDAVRLSKPKNPGNRQGVDTVLRGAKTWLMMYYTVNRMPGPMTRVTTYEILHQNHVLFKIAYKATKVSEFGHFVRYTDRFVVSGGLPYGTYTYRGTLSFGGKSKSRSWKFAIVRSASIAPSRRNLLLRLEAAAKGFARIR